MCCCWTEHHMHALMDSERGIHFISLSSCMCHGQGSCPCAARRPNTIFMPRGPECGKSLSFLVHVAPRTSRVLLIYAADQTIIFMPCGPEGVLWTEHQTSRFGCMLESSPAFSFFARQMLAFSLQTCMKFLFF
jgi:hypothetical protein